MTTYADSSTSTSENGLAPFTYDQNPNFDSGFLARLCDKAPSFFSCAGQQFDGDGNLLHKIDTRLSASSYGEDELISLNQSYIYA